MSATGRRLREELIALLRERSLAFGTFHLASGLTSPYYIDARRTTMSARGLELVGQVGLRAIRSASWTPASVGGLTLGADPVAYAIALASRHAPPTVDAFTVRKEAKRHGTGRRIEGCFEQGDAVVVLEDVLTTGRSALTAIKTLESEGALVLGVLAIVDRQEGGRAALEAAGYTLQTVLSLDELGVSPPPDARRRP